MERLALMHCIARIVLILFSFAINILSIFWGVDYDFFAIIPLVGAFIIMVVSGLALASQFGIKGIHWATCLVLDIVGIIFALLFGIFMAVITVIEDGDCAQGWYINSCAVDGSLTAFLLATSFVLLFADISFVKMMKRERKAETIADTNSNGGNPNEARGEEEAAAAAAA